MALVAETDLLVFGTRITDQHVGCLEVDGLTVIEHRIDTVSRQDLVTAIVGFVNVL
jgi:hypothetical protein